MKEPKTQVSQVSHDDSSHTQASHIQPNYVKATRYVCIQDVQVHLWLLRVGRPIHQHSFEQKLHRTNLITLDPTSQRRFTPEPMIETSRQISSLC